MLYVIVASYDVGVHAMIRWQCACSTPVDTRRILLQVLYFEIAVTSYLHVKTQSSFHVHRSDFFEVEARQVSDFCLTTI